MGTNSFLKIIHMDTIAICSLSSFQLFSYKWGQFDSTKSYILIHQQSVDSADFNYFHTNGDNLIPQNHTCYYKSNPFTRQISTIFIQIGTILIPPNHKCWYKSNLFTRQISTLFIQMGTIWFLQVIHIDTIATFSLGRFQPFSFKWKQFDSSKSYIWKQ